MRKIVVIAHDSQKDILVEFVKNHEQWIEDVEFLATGRTAEHMESKELEVTHLSPGASGGYNEITNMVLGGTIELVLFFMDHLAVSTHHVDIKNLLNACNEKNIPMATNYASAELILVGYIKKTAAERTRNKTL
jgi:methylglyoxal synthase